MKYHNRKTIVDGITFDSKAEAERYKELKRLELIGVIKGLELQKLKKKLMRAVYGIEITEVKAK